METINVPTITIERRQSVSLRGVSAINNCELCLRIVPLGLDKDLCITCAGKGVTS